MMKKIIKNARGVTLISVISLLVIMAILSGIVITNIDIGSDIRDYNYMCADIELLESKIMTYYNKNGDIPVGDTVENVQAIIGEQKNARDDDVYYVIDKNKLSNLTLNYGYGNLSNKDIYIINEKSHKVYYLKGTIYEGEIYYTDILER